jgi:RimJ/RimL family protein N-acetyltransferase
MTVQLPLELAGERVVLRCWRIDDAATLSALVQANLEHLRPWMPWAAAEPLTVAQRIELIASWTQTRDAGGDAVYGIHVDGEAIGGCGLHRRIGPDGLEIGYWVARSQCRRGYATEAAALLTATALSIDGIDRVEIHHDKANIASAGVPRRLGYRFVLERPDEETAPGGTGIEWVWRIER